MHVAIDDTYGPITATPSKYVTGARRTYVAVEFPDESVDDIRTDVGGCLAATPELLGISPTEFHFAEIYRAHRWRVHVQTVDDRTLADHGIGFDEIVDGIDLRERDGQALFFLLANTKRRVAPPPERLTVLIDAGREKPGEPIARALFRDWGDLYDGRYVESHREPLVQIADFLAFSTNRTTHLSLKPQRAELDHWFLKLIASMEILSDDLARASLPQNFTTEDVDEMHSADRKRKGLE